MPAPDPPTEPQRVYPRVPVAAGRASVRVLGEVDPRSARVLNLSRSGVLLETDLIPLGARVQTIFLGLDTKGSVVRVVSRGNRAQPPRVAIRFDEIQDPDWRAIRLLRQ